VGGIRRYLRNFSRTGLDRTRQLVNHLDGIAQAHGVTIAQVALQWLVSFNGLIVVAIPGATSPAHADENAAAMNLTLSGDELASIEAESRLLMRRAG
jgi:aryl-alcohol dehydrogenase-like predicted oxidoreductase